MTGIVNDKGGLVAALIVSNRPMVSDFGEPQGRLRHGRRAPGGPEGRPGRRHRVLDRSTRGRGPHGEEFKDESAGQVDQLLSLIYALLALAVIVSLFGIVNTLVLSISERTRELGLLRAIGTTRRQVKRIVRYEAVITSLIGGVLGIVVGAVLAVLFTQPLDNFTLTIPWGSLIFLFFLAGARRRGGGDPPGPPRRQARRARRAGLRVGRSRRRRRRDRH